MAILSKKNKVTKIAFILLNIYKFFISPILQFISMQTGIGGCRFYPNCSEYSKQIIQIHGLSFITLRSILYRILRCQPFSIFNKKSCGYDPAK